MDGCIFDEWMDEWMDLRLMNACLMYVGMDG